MAFHHRFGVYQEPGPHVWWVTLNVRKKPFTDVRVRRAVNYAVNKDAIVRNILKSTATVSSGPIPPAITWAYTDQVAKYPYDPGRALKLLQEAGYGSGFSAVFWIPESESGMQSPKTMAQAIQADLALRWSTSRTGSCLPICPWRCSSDGGEIELGGRKRRAR